MARSPQDKQDRILAAALSLFNERGYHGTPVPLICEQAGVAAGTIYRYFDSKEKLVNVLYQHWKQQMISQVLQDFPFSEALRVQFGVFWARLAEFALRHPEAFSFLEMHHHSQYLNEETRQLQEAFLAPAHAFLAACAEAGLGEGRPPELQIAMLGGMFNGVFKAALEGRLPLEARTFEIAEARCWKALME